MANNSNYYDFYEECKSNNFIDFNDSYQRQKITLIAKKHNIINNYDFSESDFKDAVNKHDQ